MPNRPLKRSWTRWADAAAALVAFTFGVAVCLAFGRIGFMPLDQSIIFDGAWRMLCGQVPFRDFTLPNGLVPILMQAALFRGLGLTWFSYCLHAALVNGLFAVLVFGALRRFGASAPVAGWYAAAGAVVMYPPIGTPYMDQHAFFFTAIAVVLAVEARCRAGRAKAWLWLAVPLAWALAYASKQIPTMFALPLLVLMAASEAGPSRRRAALALGGGGVLVLVAAWAAAMLGHVTPHEVAYAVQELPSQVGAERLQAFRDPLRLLKAAAYVLLQGWQSAGALASLIGGALIIPRLLQRDDRRGLAAVGLAMWLLATCLAFSLLTNNEPANGLAYGFWALGLVHVAARRLGGRLAIAVPAALLLLGGADAAAFVWRVDAPRTVHELQLPPGGPPGGAALPEALGYMRWALPEREYHYAAGDLTRVVRFFDAHPGRFFLVGDTAILYGLTGRPSINPALWFHPGLTMPVPHSPDFGRYLDALRAAVRREHVNYIVVEGAGPLAPVRLADLAGAFAPGAIERASAEHIGGFTILTLPAVRE